MSIQLLHGNCLDLLKQLPDNSVDSVVTDPPYGLKFMNKHWDHDVPKVEIWQECLRVLKPGGHLLAFAGTRTQHRMAVNIEDAGFEIRDMIAWVYGSGMPKHKSGLKPALEPITLARKPASKATLLNIDACRVGIDATDDIFAKNPHTKGGFGHAGASIYGDSAGAPVYDPSKGRYPANVIHDGSDEVIELFPDSNGAGPSLPNVKITGYGDGAVGTGESKYLGGPRKPFNSGSGSAARFFYCAKASRKDRDEGLEGFEAQQTIFASGTGFKNNGDGTPRNQQPSNKNVHPTVKPTDLMRYLCRLVTPLGGVVLDPFMGSGSTGKGAVLEGFQFIGMEMDANYIKIANRRIHHAAGTPDFLIPEIDTGEA